MKTAFSIQFSDNWFSLMKFTPVLDCKTKYRKFRYKFWPKIRLIPLFFCRKWPFFDFAIWTMYCIRKFRSKILSNRLLVVSIIVDIACTMFCMVDTFHNYFFLSNQSKSTEITIQNGNLHQFTSYLILILIPKSKNVSNRPKFKMHFWAITTLKQLS